MFTFIGLVALLFLFCACQISGKWSDREDNEMNTKTICNDCDHESKGEQDCCASCGSTSVWHGSPEEEPEFDLEA